MSKPDRPVYVLHLRPEPHVVDVVRVLRAALKRLLRDHGLRAISVEESSNDDELPSARG
jgi:hypothetical protein